jgi:hypothetical protein
MDIKKLRFVEKMLTMAVKAQRVQKADPGFVPPDPEKLKAIVEFFTNNPPPYEDMKVHDLAESLGLPPDELEEMIYNLIGSFFSGGKSNGARPAELTDEVLAEGMKVESEHTDNPRMQAKIVYDHVAELGNNYYAELKKMEQALKAKGEA